MLVNYVSESFSNWKLIICMQGMISVFITVLVCICATFNSCVSVVGDNTLGSDLQLLLGCVAASVVAVS